MRRPTIAWYARWPVHACQQLSIWDMNCFTSDIPSAHNLALNLISEGFWEANYHLPCYFNDVPLSWFLAHSISATTILIISLGCRWPLLSIQYLHCIWGNLTPEYIKAVMPATICSDDRWGPILWCGRWGLTSHGYDWNWASSGSGVNAGDVIVNVTHEWIFASGCFFNLATM